MTYVMPPTIRYCDIGDQRVFLDFQRDRYFQLPARQNEAFGRIAAGVSDPGASDLLGLGILVAAGTKPDTQPRPLPDVASSLPEIAPPPRGGVRDLLHVWRAVRKARRAKKPSRLAKTLLEIEASPDPQVPPRFARDAMALRFAAARRLVPIEPNCLLDALAMHYFMKHHGLRVRVVIGVMLSPFRAHSWAQDGDVALNDTLAGVQHFTPIMVA